MYEVKWKFFLGVEYATAYGYILNAKNHHRIDSNSQTTYVPRDLHSIVNDTTESTVQ